MARDVDFVALNLVSSFKASRELYGKTDGNQGHVIIQSFKPDEVTPELLPYNSREALKLDFA
jgi:hypothetical protein